MPSPFDRPTERLNAEECARKAEQYRHMARSSRRPEERSLLEQIAESWERLAKSYSDGSIDRSFRDREKGGL